MSAPRHIYNLRCINRRRNFVSSIFNIHNFKTIRRISIPIMKRRVDIASCDISLTGLSGKNLVVLLLVAITAATLSGMSPLVCVGYPLECVVIPLATGTQLDNGSWPHVSAATMQWYADNNVHRLDWPARSPDLNPIEHLWAELDRRLRSREMRPTSIVQLSAMLQEEWRRIPVDILTN
ncbi:hypothetical protein ANN_25752 [Periplaneta americana]|uniref:Tc1-like transposase DDE domain-containing protein n=1 Tax=Periplaneta americana TaxID=6978 RepID=A0ABQ8S412_PERAM|nr:hypothetical protein ANN_25752 [Periplaneta americana]